jgi:hypothetical protein
VDKESFLAKLGEIEATFDGLPPSDALDRARYQCERLRHAVRHAHSEGVRFAAFTLGRLLEDRSHGFPDSARTAYEALRTAFEEAGYKLHH